MNKILYISHDGIFDHIGQSQILPYLKINSSFYKIFLITYEKKIYNDRIASVKHQLYTSYGIEWLPQAYHKSLLGKFYDFFKLILFSAFIILKKRISFSHCRGYIPTLGIYFINKILNNNYLFDIRDFWADEGLEIKKHKFVYKIIKKIEGKMIKNAKHVVCLTNSAKKYILEKYSDIKSENISIIPCGTDFNLFNPNSLNKKKIKQIKKILKFKNKKILLYYGSIGLNYLLDKKIFFFKSINKKNDWVFLFLINNDLEFLKKLLISKGMNSKDFKILNVDRNELPEYLSMVDLSIFFYREGMRSIGCSPTKLADLFAMNIPIITDSNLGDMNKIINFKKNKSHVLKIFNKYQIVNKTLSILNEKKFVNIRNNSRYFDLRVCSNKYLNIYKNITNSNI